MSEIALTRHWSGLARVGHRIDGVLAPVAQSRREIERYLAAERGDGARSDVVDRHVRLHRSAEHGRVDDGVHHGALDAGPAERHVHVRGKVELHESSLPFVRHSTHHGRIGVKVFDVRHDDFTHRICDKTVLTCCDRLLNRSIISFLFIY